MSLSTIDTPFFGLDHPGYVDPRVAYRHLGTRMNKLDRFWAGHD
ncbi:hypothetical protein AB0M44_33205 [Streptosporangium subroseum]